MAEFKIPALDWPAHLSDALRKASPGVTILVSPCAATEAQP